MDIGGFMLAIAPVALSPGASFTLAINNVIHRGLRGVISIITGTMVGIYIHALLVGIGLTQLLIRYPALIKIMQITGTGYLLWLALRFIYRGLQSWGDSVAVATQYQAGIKEALLANLLNSKAILLWLTVAPLFAGSAIGNYLLLASIHISIMALWLLACGTLVSLSRRKFSLRWLKVIMDCGGGAFLFIVTLWPWLAD